MIIFLAIILLFLLVFIFWQGSLLFSTLTSAPTVYADEEAIVQALKFAGLKKGELLVDLGCGDAKSLIIAAKKFGAKGIGVEISPFCYINSRIKVAWHKQSKNIKIIFGDFKKAENYLEQADLVYLYLLNKVMRQIEPWVFSKISKKTRIVALCFEFAKHMPGKSVLTQNLGRETKISLYSKNIDS